MCFAQSWADCISVRDWMTNCWFCGTEMIWGGDHSFEDYGREGEGIVANLSCPNCKAYAEFYSGEEDD